MSWSRLIAKRAACQLGLCAVFIALHAELAAADALSVEEVLRAPSLAAYSPPAISPDNRLLAYVVADTARHRMAIDRKQLLRSGIAWYGVAADVWITDLSSGNKRNLTRASGHNWAPQWSPDGRYLAFLADRTGHPQLEPARLWIWDRASDELRQMGEVDVREGFTGLQWTADSRAVLVSLFPENLSRDEYVARISGMESPASGDSAAADRSNARVFEFDPAVPATVSSGDLVNLDLWRRDVGLVDVQNGKLRRAVAGARIGHYALAPDGRHLAYSVLQGAEKPGAGQYLYDLVVQDLATATTRPLARQVRLNLVGLPFAWAPGSDKLAWRTSGPLAQDEIHTVVVAGGASRLLVRSPRDENLAFLSDDGPPVWDSGGRNIFFTRDGVLWRAPGDGSKAAAFAKSASVELAIIAPRQQRLFSPDNSRSALVMSSNPSTKRMGFARINLQSGAVSQLFEETKRYGGYEVEPTISNDGRLIAYAAEDPLDAANIFALGGEFTEPRKVSEVAPALTRHSFGQARILEWSSLDGKTQRGALVFSADHRAGTRYPLIVKVYGGSSISDDLHRFGYASAPVENLQLFATRGYALLLTDSTLELGTPMFDLLKSVMPGVDKAIELGVADPARLGIMGHSYGGYSTLALIAQSKRFKAAVMRAGTGNLISGYGHLLPDGSNPGITWSESGQGRMGGTPWEFRERYVENSPIFYLDRVTTPLLIVHGERDEAVPAFLADEVFSGLRRLGRAVTYVRYTGEGHWEGQWSYADQVDVLQREIEWFDRHLKSN
jgi:dipeptidyl aminopeptidase/acylaminoacyl peptidase